MSALRLHDLQRENQPGVEAELELSRDLDLPNVGMPRLDQRVALYRNVRGGDAHECKYRQHPSRSFRISSTPDRHVGPREGASLSA